MPFPYFIDNTQRDAFVACPLKWSRQFIRNLAPNMRSVHLHAGGAFARGLEVARRTYYEGHATEDEALCLGFEAIVLEWGDPQDFADEPKNLTRILLAFDEYFREYPLPTDSVKPMMSNGKAAVEFSFSIPLPINNPDTGEPLLFVGRFDMLGEFNKSLFVVDEKTTVALGQQWAQQWDLKCFSPETELLTYAGWKQIDSISEGEAVIQYNEGELSFVAAENVHSADYEGGLISLGSGKVRQLVTPNHRILLNQRRGGNKTVLAEELHFQDKHHSIPVSGFLRGIKLPDALQRYIVMLQADGTLQYSKGEVESGQGHREHMPYPAAAFRFAKQRKVDRCIQILEELGVDYTVSTDGFGIRVSGFTQLQETVMQFVSEDKKFILGQESFFSSAFLLELPFWDGHLSQYYTIHESNARFVQTISHLNGKRCSVAKKINQTVSWVVIVSEDVTASLNTIAVKDVQYKGKVYCVSVPSSYLLTRLNGVISVSGNSQFTGYCAAAREYGYPVAGAIIRGVGLLKNETTFSPVIQYRPDWQIDRWWQQLLRDVQRMVDSYTSNQYDAALSEACASYGGCAFRRLCLSKDPEQWIDGYFIERIWDPLAKH